MRWLQPAGRFTFGAVAVAISSLCLISPAAARNCTSAEARAADRQLWLNARDTAYSISLHLPWGIPVETSPTTNERTLVQRDYVIRYDDDLRVPTWTAENVRAGRLDERVSRTDCFRRDPRLSGTISSLPSDYREPIHDQGHMTPFANQRYSRIAGNNSFIMTNMTPQNCQLNRGIWQILEQITRRWASRHENLYVLQGSVFDRDQDGRRDPDETAERMVSRNGRTRVAIPSAYYKIIAVQAADGAVETLSFLLPHDRANPEGAAALLYLQEHVTGLATLEQLSGLDLFPEATQIRESESLWAFDGYDPNSLCHQ